MAPSDDTAAAEGLSDYERRRAENIERNNARLRELGLITALEEERSNALAWKRPILAKKKHDGDDKEDGGSDDEYKEPNDGTKKTKNKKKRKSQSTTAPTLPSRKSRRLQGMEVENLPSGLRELPPSRSAIVSSFETEEEREARVKECREARQRAALEVAKTGAQVAAKQNPTATYEHCLMRVKTMSEAKLANRVKVIERAAGKHCVVKMAIFKSCLQDEGMWELAKLANEALQRLMALQPPPTEG